MRVFEEIHDKILARFRTWIKIGDPKSQWTIEDFSYETGVDEKVTNPHCWKCVTVNHCWFKDEDGKKPEEFNYSKYSLIDIPTHKRGLYHPNCHCKKNYRIAPSVKDINLIIPPGKIGWLFHDKIHKMHDYGYYNEDEKSIVNILGKATIEAFVQGNYKCNAHDERGFRITLFATIDGANHRKGERIKIKTGFSIFPDGKLKCNTLWGGEWKWKYMI